MKAKRGETIRIRGHRVGAPDRVGTIVDVQGANGGPPYQVRWEGSDNIHTLYPGSDAQIEAKK